MEEGTKAHDPPGRQACHKTPSKWLPKVGGLFSPRTQAQPLDRQRKGNRSGLIAFPQNQVFVIPLLVH